MSMSIQRIRSIGGRFLVPPHRSKDAEILDGENYDSDELAENFRDIRRVNRLLGGTSAILRFLPGLFESLPANQPTTILDLATGIGDIPVAIVQWAKRHDRQVHIVASDSSSEILALAQKETAAHMEISIARYDARAVPLPDRQFDIVLCSLSLHHFAPDDATQVLREMRRLARTGVVVNDLYRSRAGYVAAWAAARLTTRNRLTRNDAPLSVLRAYTPDELGALLHQAGFTSPSITKHFWFRMTAVDHRGCHEC
jgi:ubiquinone/menaquinone biosynthesis C-methylase UbiE